MRPDQLEAVFPNLANSGYRVTSPADPGDNCLAWAVGDTSHFWDPVRVRGYYWPPEVFQSVSLGV
jgi:hypothetical protein